MTAAKLASRLEARQVGDGRWVARCPAHDDRHPSLSIGVGRNGGTVVHCRSHRCDPSDIMAAVGLELSDLFPPSDQPRRPTRRRPENERHRALLASDGCYAASWASLSVIAASIRRAARERQRLAELYQRLMACRAGVPRSTAMRMPLGELRALLEWCAEIDAGATS